MLDDDLFECLRKWAESEPLRAPLILARYGELMPKGSHASDVDKWLRVLAIRAYAPDEFPSSRKD